MSLSSPYGMKLNWTMVEYLISTQNCLRIWTSCYIENIILRWEILFHYFVLVWLNSSMKSLGDTAHSALLEFETSSEVVKQRNILRFAAHWIFPGLRVSARETEIESWRKLIPRARVSITAFWTSILGHLALNWRVLEVCETPWQVYAFRWTTLASDVACLTDYHNLTSLLITVD